MGYRGFIETTAGGGENNISKDITSLSNYFVTSDGEDFLATFLRALEMVKEVSCDMEITSL